MMLTVALLGLPSVARAVVEWDVTADWSDASNPNGPWAYRHGTAILPHVAAWESAVPYFSGPQPAWARDDVGSTRIPSFFRSSADVIPEHDYQIGDVVSHTQDDANGIGSGPANVTWQSPVEGTVQVGGGVWMGRDIGRSEHWSLWLNTVKLTEGDIASGDPYSRATPFAFSAGSGGSAAVANLTVHVGDVVKLLLERTSQYGDFVGIRMRVSTVPPTDVSGRGAAGATWLADPRPNPSPRGFVARFSLAHDAPVEISVHDVGGRLRSILVSGTLAAGEHDVAWQDLAPAGVYFLRLRAEGYEIVRRIVALR